MKRILYLFFLIIPLFSFSQKNFFYPITSIPDSLKDNAGAVIRYEKQTINIPDNKGYTVKVYKVVTVLKSSGKKYAAFHEWYDKSSKIKFKKGVVYNALGIKIGKVKKSEIQDNSMISGFSLYEDNREKYFRPAIEPPYTIEYEYEISREGTLFLPSFTTPPRFNISVQKSVFDINFNNVLHKIKFLNYSGDMEEFNDVIGTKKYLFTVENVPAVIYEFGNRDFKDYSQNVLFEINHFIHEGNVGSINTWGDLGNWYVMLNRGRQKLPEETKQKIKEITSGLESDYDKTKAIYQYMQSKTRYVSIQMGIGGLQPFDAETVDRMGYGDCKALSNYTLALLQAAGIKSHYTVVMAGTEAPDILTDFPSKQSNHIILCVPFEKDTVWLECTNQKTPFGYIGDFTDDRHVLLISENGSKLVKTKAYNSSENKSERTANINIKQTGNIEGEVKTSYTGLQYDNVLYIKDLPEKEKLKKLKKKYPLTGLKIKDMTYIDNPALIPTGDEILKFSADKYASVSSRRIFIAPNVFNKHTYSPDKIENRKTNIIVKRPEINKDIITFSLPENYSQEFLPENTDTITKFGHFKVQYKFKDNKLTYYRELETKKGTFPPSDYEEYRDFYKLIKKSDETSAVFVKKE